MFKCIIKVIVNFYLCTFVRVNYLKHNIYNINVSLIFFGYYK